MPQNKWIISKITFKLLVTSRGVDCIVQQLFRTITAALFSSISIYVYRAIIATAAKAAAAFKVWKVKKAEKHSIVKFKTLTFISAGVRV